MTKPYRLSVLDQSPIAEGHTSADALANTIDLARRCDTLGYDRYWLAEHHASPGLAGVAPEALIGPVALATKRIRVGSGGIMLPHYSPFKVAETFRMLGPGSGADRPWPGTCTRSRTSARPLPCSATVRGRCQSMTFHRTLRKSSPISAMVFLPTIHLRHCETRFPAATADLPIFGCSGRRQTAPPGLGKPAFLLHCRFHQFGRCSTGGYLSFNISSVPVA